jgi:hypothetical protein
MGLWSVVRWVRAASFAAMCAALAAAGHVLGGGWVDRRTLLAGFALTFVPALAMTRRERTIATILPAVALCQVVLHALLSQAGAAHPMPSIPAVAHVPHAAHPGAGMPELPGGPPFGPGMLLMHAVAVLVTSWWLECGEARLCALVRRMACWALRSFTRLRPVLVYGPAPVVRARRHVQVALWAVILRHVMVRRGPPAGSPALG